VISDGLLNLFSTVLELFFSWMVSLCPPVPSFVGDGFASVGGLYPYLGFLENWVPVPLVVSVGAVLIGAWLSVLALKTVRIVLSFLTLGGGAL